HVVEEDRPAFVHPEDQQRQVLQNIMVTVREHFKHLLPGSKAQDYLHSRGVNQDSIAAFHLGFCPPDFSPVQYLTHKGVALDVIQKSGLVFRNEQGEFVSRFRNRVMFPILDERGRTVGFSGRTLDHTDKIAKYINSDETLLFSKRKLLYGLDL